MNNELYVDCLQRTSNLTSMCMSRFQCIMKERRICHDHPAFKLHIIYKKKEEKKMLFACEKSQWPLIDELSASESELYAINHQHVHCEHYSVMRYDG